MDNSGHYRKDGGSMSFAEFDSLPKPLREFLSCIPFNCATDDIVWALNAGYSCEQIIECAMTNMQQQLRDEAPAIWRSLDYPVPNINTIMERK